MRKLKINGYCVEYEDGGEHPKGIRCPMGNWKCTANCAWFSTGLYTIQLSPPGTVEVTGCYCKDYLIGELEVTDASK